MIYESKTNGLVELKDFVSMKRDFMFKDKKFLILLRINAGSLVWGYSTEADRDAEYEEIKKVLKVR